MADVLRISLDIAAGLSHLHDLPDVATVAEQEGEVVPLTSVQEMSENVTTTVVGAYNTVATRSHATRKIVHRGESWGCVAFVWRGEVTLLGRCHSTCEVCVFPFRYPLQT
jgi:hypothetical protein